MRTQTMWNEHSSKDEYFIDCDYLMFTLHSDKMYYSKFSTLEGLNSKFKILIKFILKKIASQGDVFFTYTIILLYKEE